MGTYSATSKSSVRSFQKADVPFGVFHIAKKQTTWPKRKVTWNTLPNGALFPKHMFFCQIVAKHLPKALFFPHFFLLFFLLIKTDGEFEPRRTDLSNKSRKRIEDSHTFQDYPYCNVHVLPKETCPTRTG